MRIRHAFFPRPTFSSLPVWVLAGAFALPACAPSTEDDPDPAGGGGSGGQPGELPPDASGAGGTGSGGAVEDAAPAGGQQPDMSTGLIPDAAPPAPDAFVPAPDAFVPAPDAFVPAPDALVPAPDAFVPAPDAFVPAPDAFIPPPDAALPTPDHCGPGEVLLGEFATHCGQVNVVRPAGGAWAPDADCSSGCDNEGIAYCLSEFPETTRIVPVEVSLEDKPFVTGGCGEVIPQPGSAQYACCAPAPICPAGQRLVGRFATQCGMVNVHAEPAGPWSVDADCSSGCNVNDVGYCQRFWPESVSVGPMPVEPVSKPFTDAGCGTVFDVQGQAQYGCCAPILD